MPKNILSDEQIAQFHRDGYVIVRGLFDREEADILRKTAKADAAFKQHAYDLKDGEGGATKLASDGTHHQQRGPRELRH